MSDEVATPAEPPITDLVEIESEGHREWSDSTKTQLIWGCRKYRCKQCQSVSQVIVNGEALRQWFSGHNCIAPQ